MGFYDSKLFLAYPQMTVIIMGNRCLLCLVLGLKSMNLRLFHAFYLMKKVGVCFLKSVHVFFL